MATQLSEKPIHSIIIDTGPLINNTVSISTIINSAEVLYTTPAIIAEIRDPATRSRVETTLLPFLNVKTPSPASYDAVTDFAKKTGDFPVLSKQDLGILALAYEVHCEKHGGSFGLRSVPRGPVRLTEDQQRKANEEAAEKRAEEAKQEAEYAQLREKKAELKRQQKVEKEASEASGGIVTDVHQQDIEAALVEGLSIESEHSAQQDQSAATVETPENGDIKTKKKKVNSKKARRAREYAEKQALLKDDVSGEQALLLESQDIPASAQETVSAPAPAAQPAVQEQEQVSEQPEQREAGSGDAVTENEQNAPQSPQRKMHPAKARLARRTAEREALANEDLSPTQQPTPPTSDDDSDSNEWITPGNLSKHQQQDTSDAPLLEDEPQLSVATMTSDYAMQNVLLQMNMHLLSPAMQRIRQARSTILRCHACFLTTREMEKQFCPRCGQPTLQRVSCSTNAKGEFQVHLSTKYQYNKRGNKYSIPKPVGGTSNGKMRGSGGGKGGWGRDLVLSEDQKEFQRQTAEQKRMQAKDPMDQDYLPDILTGNRSKADGRPKVGAGRNVNSRKRV